MITKYLKLDKTQSEAVAKWQESIPLRSFKEAEEDCSLAGPTYKFEAYGTGLGDMLFISTKTGGKEYKLTFYYDDDGEFVADATVTSLKNSEGK